MSLKVITLKDYDGLPAGSVLQRCVIVEDFEGLKYYEGLHCSRAGSYYETVPLEICEIFDEEKNDKMFVIKKYLAQKNEIKLK